MNTSITNQMQITEEIRTFWKKYWEKGDNQLLSAELKCTGEHVSRLMTGKHSEAPVSVVSRITKFYTRRKEAQKAIHEIVDQD